MKEKEFIHTIKSVLNNNYIGDDCAYLPDLGIVVTQDSLVEDIHFKLNFITPYQLGYKSVMVNMSDIYASGAKPTYITISLSLPPNINSEFIKKFYEGAKAAAKPAKIVGGDITGSNKIYISVTAIGKTSNRSISSRSFAKTGYSIIVSGEHGNSATGLKKLLKGENCDRKFLEAHLTPKAQKRFSEYISLNIKDKYAMIDSSDGLADAVFRLAEASNVTIKINTSKIPHDKEVDIQTVLFGGEDYQLVAAVPDSFLINNKEFCYTIIGNVINNKEKGLIIDEIFYSDIDDKLFNHFERYN